MRYGFVLNQLLGHATHGQNLKSVLAKRDDLSSWHLEVPFVTPHRLYGRMKNDVMLRIYIDTLWGVSRRDYVADALFFHTMDAALFSPHILTRTPSIVSLDATPLQFKRLNGFDRPQDVTLTVAERIKVGILKSTRLKQRLVQAIFARAKHIVTWSEWAKGSVVSDYGISPERVTIIPPGVDVGRFAPAESRATGTTIRILFIGGEFERKGGALLVKWMRERGSKLNCELHLITQSAVEESKGIVVHTDVTPNSERLVSLLQYCDIFALPTKAECFGIAIVEAMASGLAIVSSKLTAIPEIIRHDDTGVLVDPGDYNALAVALEALVNDPDRRQALGRAARIDAENRFSLQNYDRLINCFVEQTAPSGFGTQLKEAH